MLRLVAATAIAVGLAGSTASARVAADEPLPFSSDGRLRAPAATAAVTAG